MLQNISKHFINSMRRGRRSMMEDENREKLGDAAIFWQIMAAPIQNVRIFVS